MTLRDEASTLVGPELEETILGLYQDDAPGMMGYLHHDAKAVTLACAH